MDCLFCKIAAGEIPAQVVYQDEQVLAFKDIAPAAPVHVLIIPKKHIESLLDMQSDDAQLAGHILTKVVPLLAKQLGIDESGFRLVANTKEDGGQTVLHLHFHLLGGRSLNWPPG